MLDVTDGLVDELRDMDVVERIDDPPTLARADHQPDVTKQTKLMGDRRLLHPDRVNQLRDRMRTLTQLRQDQHPARRGQALHRVRDPLGHLRRHRATRRATIKPVTHPHTTANMSNRSLNKCS